MGPKHAIILAGGIGSRMLPVSSMVPKEIMPLIDLPAINYAIEEIKDAGIKNIHIVINEQKKWIIDVLNYNEENIKSLQKIRNEIPSNFLNPSENINLQIHIQETQLGFANAISYALNEISGPFLVLLGDNILINEHLPPTTNKSRSNASLNLIKKFNENKRPVVGLHKVDKEELSSFGVVKKINGKITEIIEKPSIENAPSDSVLCGRYLFTEDFLIVKYIIL